jgi:hypothetical protein
MSERRRDDADGFNGAPPRNGWALPEIGRLGIAGVLCFLLLFLLGAIPYLPSPVLAIQTQLREHRDETSQLLRAICRELADQASRPAPGECR